MSYRPFTKPEVETKSGKKPWQTQRAFSQELDTEHMADIAARYARVAAEARDADDLARRASQASAGAGGTDGRSLVDENGRIDETNRALQRGGRDVDQVVRHIVNGMNLAIGADQQVDKFIGWLDWRFDGHLRAYAAEYNAWNAALRSAVSARNRGPDSARRVPLIVDHGGQSVTTQVSHDAAGAPTYSLPASHYEAIRNKHLSNAARDATQTAAEIDDEINAYRHRLLAEANELADLGYDLGDGPFTLFATPAMARFTAGKLKTELAKKHPDPDLVELYTHGLKSIAEGIYGDPVAGGRPDRDLTPAELAYLHAFYDTLDANSLAKLGNMEGLAPVTNAKRNVANGIMMLMNPEIGGYSPVVGNRQIDIPDSIAHFVHDYRENWKGRAFSPEFINSVEAFNGFGGLMEEATVASGTAFSKSLAYAAVYSQEQLQADTNGLKNTGASGMLMAAALNHGASAELLGDDGFHRELLGLRWDDSRGAANLVESGTIVPPWLDRNDPEAQKYFSAAQNVLTYAAQNPDDIKGVLIGGGTAESHEHLQRAIGNTAVTHMDLLSRYGGTDSGTWENGKGEWINGTRYRYGFDLSNEDRQGLFTLMGGVQPEVRNEFFTDVAGWQYATAREAFANGGNNIGSTIENIGVIAGSAAMGQSSAGTEGLQARMSAANGAKNVFDFVGTMPGNVTAPVTWPFKYGFETYAGSLEGQISEAEAQELANLQNSDRLPARLLIADAARAAGASDIGDPPNGRPDTTTGNPNIWIRLNEYTNGVLGPNDFDDNFETGFRLGSQKSGNPDLEEPQEKP